MPTAQADRLFPAAGFQHRVPPRVQGLARHLPQRPLVLDFACANAAASSRGCNPLANFARYSDA
jgi:hypothetical protein